MSSCARATVTPGFNRPTTWIDRPRGVRVCAVNPKGSQMSTFLSRNEKPGGMTPMTEYGVPPATIGRCRIARSPPKRRFHKRSLMTITRLFGLISSGVKPRPRAGCTPSTGKASAVTSWVWSSSGSPAPVSVVLKLKLNAPRSAKPWFISRQCRKLAGATTLFLRSRGMLCSHTMARRSASWYGRGCSSSVLTTLKIAVLAPMPIASAAIAMAAKPGARTSRRETVAEVLEERHH